MTTAPQQEAIFKTNLKTRMAIAVTLLIAILLTATSFLFLHFFQDHQEESISNQNFTLVSSLAYEIDSKIRVTQELLAGIAKMVTPETMASTTKAGKLLEGHKEDLVVFDNCLLLFSPTFEVMAAASVTPHTHTLEQPLQKCLKKTLQTKMPQISEPFFSDQEKQQPVIIFTAPVLSKNNQIIGILGGKIDLLNNNFLGHLAGVQLGDKGYLYIYNQERTLIVHPKRDRILKQDVPPGVNVMFDRALDGFEGTGETVNSRGLHALSSFKRLATTNWILAGNFPIDEAYAPIHNARRTFALALISILPLSALITWLLMRHLLRPLGSLAQQISKYPDTETTEAITVNTQDEIGALAATFNRMIDRLDTKRRALKEQLGFLQVLIDVMPNPVFFKDSAGRYLGCNKAFEEHIGIPRETLLHKSVFDIAPAQMAKVYHEADTELFCRGVNQTQIYEGSIVASDGSERQVVFYKATFSNPEGQLGGLVGTVIDVTERRQAEEQRARQEDRLNFLANYDPLTRLPNRELFSDRLEHAIAKAKINKTKVALLLLDLDRFKTINDSLGHDLGNEVLCQVAERLKAQASESDTLARLGGDEFALILEDAEELTSVLRTAQNLLEKLITPLTLKDQKIYPAASIGISMFPNDGENLEDMMKCAEVAMYRAKEKGRNNYQFYRPEMNVRSRERLILEGALRQALQLEQFTLHYQPQVDLATGQTVGAEALVRWHHPSLGTVSPADFIPLAEETGLIIPLGDWVLHSACQQIKKWSTEKDKPFKVAVNISALQFRDPNFIDKVDQIIQETQIDPEYLEMEITESVIMEDVDESILTLTDLKVRGISLALDDFGTGYSSLSYLQKFPITHLKIDRSFVKDVCTNPQSAEIAGSIIGLGQSTKLKVIAEGIETFEHLAFFKDKGCDRAQGFLFSRPIPPEEIEEKFL